MNSPQQTLIHFGLGRAWNIYMDPTRATAFEERTIRDIVGKLVRYGSASDNALQFVGTLLERIALREAQPTSPVADCPSGRVIITGEILSTKQQDTQFGTVTKMLVRAAQGYKVWLTKPAACEAGKGDTITLTATVEPSKDDPKFGFGKRPVMGATVKRQPTTLVVPVTPAAPPAPVTNWIPSVILVCGHTVFTRGCDACTAAYNYGDRKPAPVQYQIDPEWTPSPTGITAADLLTAFNR